MSSHNEVAHAWANQTGKHRKGHAMFYEGDTIYSWGHHFAIARRVQTAEGIVVLLTNRTYSVSTTQHTSKVQSASLHFKTFRVVNPRGENHHFNVRHYLQEISDTLEKSKRARSNKAWHYDRAVAMIEEVKDYIRVFEVEGFESINLDPEGIVTGVRELAEASRRMEEATRLAREHQAKKRYREEVWPKLKAWLRNETGPVRFNTHTARPLPRIEGDQVVTTWGATVPLPIATRLYWMAVKCRREHQGFVPTIEYRVGDFTLRHIKKNGDMVVGCHDIPFWFMHYAARTGGIPSQPLYVLAEETRKSLALI
ncbi:hypothetical protein [Mesorhizobium sp. B2-8-3]|uniref:hypothetical protein n=1 Tax=Mesorhizobium sp. B2-8-3 TaxID=2589905 RepID=UPI00112CABD3|nr:hypothetical protein [Mesorhizobium sp. B2-8-3]TPJ33694.1 hypothetical protein FJ418_13780 [Mesorhizobium sp. B2-8-3]